MKEIDKQAVAEVLEILSNSEKEITNKIPENFTIERYGLNVRLVEEKDAGFILSLRTNPKLSRYIHNTDDSLDKQRQWIRDYKKRELEGKDYYFI